MKKGTIACCYLTHNHPDIVKDILDRSLKDYLDHGIDVCICDDSDNDETRILTEQYCKSGNEGLHYVDMHGVKTGDDKLLNIFLGERLPGDYDYLWTVKDRVCFAPSYLDRLCSAVEKGPDVILGCNEGVRWDVSRRMIQDEYRDPAHFYRDYGFVTTNWEAVIMKRSSILRPLNRTGYEERYGVGPDNPFNQLLILFGRMSGMNDPLAMIVRYEPGERYISEDTGMSWYKVIFDLWIDKWIAANFSLPSVYDPYKLETIKAETNHKEVFGSLEGMIAYSEAGIYNKDVFDKYKNIWPMVTDIPVEWLEDVAYGKYGDARDKAFASFEKAVSEGDHIWASQLFVTNSWFDSRYDELTYRVLRLCCLEYRADLVLEGRSDIFTGLNSVPEIVEKYKGFV